MRSRSVVNVPSSSSTLVNWSLPRFSCLFAILKLLPCSMTLWIVVALCFMRSLRCFLRISLFSSVTSIFSLADLDLTANHSMATVDIHFV